ncbi:ZP1 protein, partial [Rhinopomastus cyanomelas]|nr:ZP1 protein [Rhinopomastus cyanomelas]
LLLLLLLSQGAGGAASPLRYRYDCGDRGMQLLAFPARGRTVRFKVLDEFGSRFEVANCSICLHGLSGGADGAVVFSSGYDGCHVLIKDHRYVLRVQLEELLLGGVLAASYEVNMTCPKPAGDHEVLTGGNHGHQTQPGVLLPLSQPGLLHQLSQSSLTLSGSHLEQVHSVAQTQPVLVHPGLQSQSGQFHPELQSQSGQSRPGLQSQSQSGQSRPGLQSQSQSGQSRPGFQSQWGQMRPARQPPVPPGLLHPGLQAHNQAGLLHPGAQTQPGLHPGVQTHNQAGLLHSGGRPGLQTHNQVHPGGQPGLRPGVQTHNQAGLLHPGAQTQPGLRPGVLTHNQAGLIHPGSQPGLLTQNQAGLVPPRSQPLNQPPIAHPNLQSQSQSGLLHGGLQHQAMLVHSRPGQAAPGLQSRPGMVRPGPPTQPQPGLELTRVQPGLLQSNALFYPSPGAGVQLTRDQCQVPLGKLPCVAPQGREACVQSGCCYDDMDRVTPCYYGNTATVQCLLNGHFVVVVPRGLGSQPYNLDSVRLATTEAGCEPARLSETFVMFHFPVTHCGTTVQAVEDQLIYENQLISTIDVQGAPRGSITRDSVYILQARCIYNASELLALRMEVAVPPTAIPMAMLGPLGLQLRIATDETYSSYHPAGDYPLVKVLRDPIYVEVRLLQKTDPNLVLVLHHCWASPSTNAAAEPQWPILVDGCPFTGDNYRTQLVAVGPASPQLPFPSHVQRFIVSTFAFVEPPTVAVLEGEVFISCSASVCHLAQPEPCRPSCQLGVPSRARRALGLRGPAEAVGTVTAQGPVVIARAPE